LQKGILIKKYLLNFTKIDWKWSDILKQSPIKHIDNDIINDKIISNLIKKYNTPLYLYDKNIIKKQFNIIKKSNAKIFYSIKANPFDDILKFFDSLGAFFEAVSIGELKKLLKNNIPLSKAIFVGPAKEKEEIAFAINNNIFIIVIESLNEFKIVKELSQKYDKRINLLIRVNPNLKSGGTINMSGVTQFGLEEKIVIDILSQKYRNINILGLHFYLGTDILDKDLIIKNTKEIIKISKKIGRISKYKIKNIDIGGGFGVAYYNNEENLDINVFEELNNIFNQNDRFNFFIESGRFLTAKSGIFITKVIDIKINFSQKFVLLNGGTNFFAIHNKSMGFRFAPIRVFNKKNEDLEKVTLVGNLCTTIDILARDIYLPKIEIDDYILFYQAGAYGYSASPILFLSHKLPKEVLI
jgi:diaminopimelate decarboxylase